MMKSRTTQEIGRPLRAAQLATVLATLSVGSWGAPRQAILTDRVEKGDRYEVTSEVISKDSGRTIQDGVDIETGSTVVSTQDRYVDTLLAVDPAGRRSAVHRKFLLARVVHGPLGGKQVSATHAIQGRSFIITGSAEAPDIDNTQGITNADIAHVAMALRAEAEVLLLPGSHSVGDSWPIPKRFFVAFNFRGDGVGECRFERIEGPAGAEHARITCKARVSLVTATGKTSDLELTGHLLWSLALKRVVSYRFGGPTTSAFTTSRGASITRTEGKGRLSVTATFRWLAVAGRPVASRE